MHLVSDNKKIGVGLTLGGSLFLFLGVLLLFDRALLALGNVLFVAGITLLIGFQKALIFFSKKVRGTVCFFFGIFLVLVGFPILGMLIEVYGIIALFAAFFPVVFRFLESMPVIGSCLNFPPVRKVFDSFMGSVLPTHQARN